jgi:ABC-type ATPase with predicted acetyltransferase domain
MSNVYKVVACTNCGELVMFEDSLIVHGYKNLDKLEKLHKEGKRIFNCRNCGEIYNSNVECDCGGSDVVEYDTVCNTVY